jgi:hypothetical protein
MPVIDVLGPTVVPGSTLGPTRGFAETDFGEVRAREIVPQSVRRHIAVLQVIVWLPQLEPQAATMRLPGLMIEQFFAKMGIGEAPVGAGVQ